MYETAEKRAKEHFTEFLRNGNYRITRERFEVLAYVMKFDEHFDAETLSLKMLKAGSQVSRATVYKTLNLLHECGLVARYMFYPGEFAQYEKTIDRPRHDHMVCIQCGKIVEFPNGSVIHLRNQLCRVNGFEPFYHTMQIFGTCEECRQKRGPASESPAPQAT